MHFYTGILLAADKVTKEAIDVEMAKFPEGEHWDWYRVGGRWDGCIRGTCAECSTDKGFNFSPKHELLVNNTLDVEDVIGLATKEDYILPCYIVVDSMWYDFHVFDKSTKDNSGLLELLGKHVGKVMVALDVHN